MRLRAFLTVVFALFVAACGGGGGNPGTCSGGPQVCGGVSSVPSGGGSSGVPAGLFQGALGTGQAATAVVFPSGEFWVLYGNGAMQGHGQFASGNFFSSDVRDVNAAGLGIQDGSLGGTFVTRSSLAATVTFQARTATFALGYLAQSDTTPSLTSVAGSYNGTVATLNGSSTATFSISTGGVLNGTNGAGCTFDGSLVPVAGVAAYQFAVTFQGSFCAAPVASAVGVAYYDATANQFRAAALNSARTVVLLLNGART